MEPETEPHLPGYDKLVPPDEFDPAVLCPDDDLEQEVCNFVLMLALFWNDFKNVLWAHNEWAKATPRTPPRLSAAWGQHTGFRLHLLRLQIALLHELSSTIYKHRNLLDHPQIHRAVAGLSKEHRTCWHELVESSLDKPGATGSSLGNLLHDIRNKVAFHYMDIKALGRGYKALFSPPPGKPRMNAFISRGLSMQASRFYFADAAVMKYLDERLGTSAEPTLQKLVEHTDRVNKALLPLITNFLQQSGARWRRYRPE